MTSTADSGWQSSALVGLEMSVMKAPLPSEVNESKDLGAFIPPGYRLTQRALERLETIAAAPNRATRRYFTKMYEKHPLTPEQTFERIEP